MTSTIPYFVSLVDRVINKIYHLCAKSNYQWEPDYFKLIIKVNSIVATQRTDETLMNIFPF